MELHSHEHTPEIGQPPPFRESFRLRFPNLALRLDELEMPYHSLFTTADTAKVLGASRRSVNRYEARGDLKKRAIGRLRFHAEDIERLLGTGVRNRSRGPGRPGVCRKPVNCTFGETDDDAI